MLWNWIELNVKILNNVNSNESMCIDFKSFYIMLEPSYKNFNLVDEIAQMHAYLLTYSLKITELNQSSQAGVIFFQLNTC